MVENINKFLRSIAEGIRETDLYVKPTDDHQYLLSSSAILFTVKKEYPTASH